MHKFEEQNFEIWLKPGLNFCFILLKYYRFKGDSCHSSEKKNQTVFGGGMDDTWPNHARHFLDQNQDTIIDHCDHNHHETSPVQIKHILILAY